MARPSFFDGEDSGRERGGTQWQRDLEGRKYRDKDGVRQYENQGDRDSVLESRYRQLSCREDKTLDGAEVVGCCRSMLQFVSHHQDELIAEYMQWSKDRNQDAYDKKSDEQIKRWEVERFGDTLYPAAHMHLLYLVRVAIFGDGTRRTGKQPRLTPGLTSEQRRDRMLSALDSLTEDRQMPERGVL